MSGWDSILKLKGWQVFVLMQTALVVFGTAMVRSAFPPVSEPTPGITGLGLAVGFLELGYFGWMLAVGAAMNARLPAELKRGTVIPSMGLAIAVAYISSAGYWLSTGGSQTSSGPVVVVLHLFSMFVNFYLLWFASRSLVAAEEKSKPSLDRVLGIFFVLWFTLFVPIGAWWVQNRARRVAGFERA